MRGTQTELAQVRVVSNIAYYYIEGFILFYRNYIQMKLFSIQCRHETHNMQHTDTQQALEMQLNPWDWNSIFENLFFSKILPVVACTCNLATFEAGFWNSVFNTNLG